MPKKGKVTKEWNPHKYLVADARKRWRYSPARNQALKKAKIAVGSWQCSKCSAVVGNLKYITKKGRKASRVDGAIDHIVPVGTQPKTWDDYPSYYRRMFCPAENLAFLCSKCHDEKSAVEREARKIARKKLKDNQ